MQTRGTDAIPLAPRPSLEQYRKQAKDLIKACRAGNLITVRAWATDWISRLARVQGLTSTPEYVVAGSPERLDLAHINREVDGITDDAGRSRLFASDARPAKATPGAFGSRPPESIRRSAACPCR